MHSAQTALGIRKVLVVCDGNTCRSPTLVLLLRYRARSLGIADLLSINSAGIGSSASDGAAMPGVAQRAAAEVAPLLRRGLGTPSVDAAALDALRSEAMQHFSKRISSNDNALRDGILVCLLTSHALPRLDQHRALRGIKSRIALPTGDRAHWMLSKHNWDESHPDVIDAYRMQAAELAAHVERKLGCVFDGLQRVQVAE